MVHTSKSQAINSDGISARGGLSRRTVINCSVQCVHAVNADKMLRIFLPISNPSTFINKIGTTTRVVPILLVQVTGFEPTRISSLEPETSASAVPPHLHFLFLHRRYALKQQVNKCPIMIPQKECVVNRFFGLFGVSVKIFSKSFKKGLTNGASVCIMFKVS